jgi:predicted RNA-binding protein YlxR (DUF448 family)/ribosomal protein L30E
MKHYPERTCIGCRGVFKKNEVVRIVAGPDGAVIDYREKLQGRAAYVCPRRDCIQKALGKEGLSRALKLRVRPPETEVFIADLTAAIVGKVKSLVSMAAKAGKLSAGYSAVKDALEKGRVEMILYARDIAEGTREKIIDAGAVSRPQATLFTREELGSMLNRELVGVVGIEEKGLADAVREETQRLNSLIKISE